MDIVQVILLTLVTQAAAEYYISEKTWQWRDAVGKCNMAVPDLHVTEDGFNVTFDYMYNHSFDADVWLGYFVKTTVFDYIGCVKLDNQMVHLLGQSNSPGLCLTVCKENEIIGVSFEKCICVDTLENFSQHERYCTTSCGSSKESVACGGNGYMSVYKVHKHAVRPGNRGMPCLSFQHYGNDIFTWLKCSTYLPVMCDGMTLQSNMPWLNSTNECFKRNKQPKSYQALIEIKTDISPSWSGVISSDVIYTYTALVGHLQGVLFGYMSANKSVYFTDIDEPKLILCNGSKSSSDHETTQTRLAITPTNPTSTRKDEWTTIMTASAEYERGDSTTMVSTKYTNGSQLLNENSQGQTVSIIVGVSVCASAAVIAVVAFIILRRRGNVPNLREIFTRSSCTAQNVMMKDHTEKPSRVIEDSEPEAVQTKQEYVNNKNNDHNYFVLEPSNSDHNLHDKNHERNKPVENGHIYNEIETEDNTYAHVDKKKQISLDEDYDTTETTAKKRKLKAESIHDDYAELGNDTYSHIGKSPASVGTDQTYNIPNRDDSYSKMDKVNDEKDTYSHLNSTQSGGFSNNSDNVYPTTNGFKDTNI